MFDIHLTTLNYKAGQIDLSIFPATSQMFLICLISRQRQIHTIQ